MLVTVNTVQDAWAVIDSVVAGIATATYDHETHKFTFKDVHSSDNEDDQVVYVHDLQPFALGKASVVLALDGVLMAPDATLIVNRLLNQVSGS